MRVEFLDPKAKLTPELVTDALSLVGVLADWETVATWTDLERLMAYDWAIRTHLHASDVPVRVRPRPSFVRPEWGGEGVVSNGVGRNRA